MQQNNCEFIRTYTISRMVGMCHDNCGLKLVYILAKAKILCMRTIRPTYDHTFGNLLSIQINFVVKFRVSEKQYSSCFVSTSN